MQAGFLCLEAGLTRSKNNINVAVKNLADYFISALVFYCFGYGLMFGTTALGWFGSNNFFPSFNNIQFSSFFIFQLMFSASCVTIISGAVAERMRFKAYLLITIIVSLIIYPIFGHWVWGGIQVGENWGWLGRIGFIDFAGGSVVHSASGWIALALILVLGPRKGRFNPDGSINEIEGSSLPLAALGTLLLFLGWFGFNGGSLLTFNNQAATIIINTILGAAGACTITLLYESFFEENISAYNLINAIIAGLVSVTAGANVISHPAAIIIGGLGAVFMLLLSKAIIHLQIDDAIGAIPVHLAGGVWGTLALALLGQPELFGTGLSNLEQLWIQFIGVSVGALWGFIPSFILFWGLNQVFRLRVTPEAEHAGLNVSEHGASTELISFLSVLEEQAQSADTSLRVPTEPFTEVGQIATRYNSVMDRLETKNDQLTTVLDNSPVALFYTDLIGTFTLIEGQIEGGVFPAIDWEEATSIYSLFEQDPESLQNISDVLQGHQRNWTAQIKDRYIYFRCKPALNSQQNINGLTGVAIDITQQRMSEIDREKVVNMLSTSSTISEQITTILNPDELISTILELLSKTYDLYHVAVLLFDPAEKTLEFKFGRNDAAEEFLSLREEIPLSHPTSVIAQAARKKEVIVLNDVSQHPNFFGHPKLDQTNAELAMPLMIQDNLIGVLDIQETTINRFNNSDISLFVSIARQIAVALNNATLFETSRLAEFNMKLALQRAIESEKAKDEFLAKVSHELRTPLGVILGYSELLQDEIYGAVSSEQYDRLDDIINSSAQLTDLVNQLLDSAKLETSHLKPSFSQFNIKELFKVVLNQMNVLAQQKELTLRGKMSKNLPSLIESDPQFIRQILINVIGNAIKFTDSGYIQMDAGVRDDQLLITVTDTGIGIPAGAQENIFKAFHQVDGSKTRQHRGTGLGLAISKQMVEFLNGSISVVSMVNKGSQFRILLPLKSKAHNENHFQNLSTPS